MCEIIGRKQEIATLNRLYKSGRPEFIALYGRRRVGKTFLVNEVFRDNMTFHHTGLSPYDRQRKVSLKDQLQNFHFSLMRHGLEGIEQPKSWMEAFFLLEKLLEKMDNGGRQVVFIDELPWMDTPKSGFLTALEAFWNGWGNTRNQLCLIVCGSAASWMLDTLINNKGGLYGRLTCEIKLSPFSLLECEEFFISRGVNMSRYNILQAYMILGGIPYYLNYFNPALSLVQNIDLLFFGKKTKMSDEFERLMDSVFNNAEGCKKIIRVLGKRHAGYCRNKLAEATGMNPNGDFSKILKALVLSDFIQRYTPFGNKKKEHYRLTDCVCWFWLHFKEEKHITQSDYWLHHLNETEIAGWRGIAFEEVCQNHIPQIKNALQIGGVSSEESSLLIKGSDATDGMQIDLIIDRADDIVNVCEIKYNSQPFVVTKAYAEKLLHRRQILQEFEHRKSIHLTLISMMPLQENIHSDIFVANVTAENLFT